MQHTNVKANRKKLGKGAASVGAARGGARDVHKRTPGPRALSCCCGTVNLQFLFAHRTGGRWVARSRCVVGGGSLWDSAQVERPKCALPNAAPAHETFFSVNMKIMLCAVFCWGICKKWSTCRVVRRRRACGCSTTSTTPPRTDASCPSDRPKSCNCSNAPMPTGGRSVTIFYCFVQILIPYPNMCVNNSYRSLSTIGLFSIPVSISYRFFTLVCNIRLIHFICEVMSRASFTKFLVS